jgi:hypothetical protein
LRAALAASSLDGMPELLSISTASESSLFYCDYLWGQHWLPVDLRRRNHSILQLLAAAPPSRGCGHRRGYIGDRWLSRQSQRWWQRRHWGHWSFVHRRSGFRWRR